MQILKTNSCDHQSWSSIRSLKLSNIPSNLSPTVLLKIPSKSTRTTILAIGWDQTNYMNTFSHVTRVKEAWTTARAGSAQSVSMALLWLSLETINLISFPWSFSIFFTSWAWSVLYCRHWRRAEDNMESDWKHSSMLSGDVSSAHCDHVIRPQVAC